MYICLYVVFVFVLFYSYPVFLDIYVCKLYPSDWIFATVLFVAVKCVMPCECCMPYSFACDCYLTVCLA